MNEAISEKKVNELLTKIIHPEINYSLVDLGMIKGVVVKDNVVTLTLKFPFLEIPIKDLLISTIEEELKKINVDVKINIAQMNEEERAKFMKMAQEGWR
jgi:metal-sulfur cluster biosynthetic enzyme